MDMRNKVRRCVQAITGLGHFPLGEDCEAWVSGRYVAHVERAGIPVPIPSWAWLNAPAYGGRDEVRRAVIDPDQLLDRLFFGWREARSVIAADLLELTDGDDQLLGWLQADVLQPMEAALFAGVAQDPTATAQQALESMRSYVSALRPGA